MPTVERRSGDALTLAIISVVFMLCFHPTLAFNFREIVDDHCYIQWLSQYLYFSYDQCYSPYVFPGAVWAWLPLGALARLFTLSRPDLLLPALSTAVGITAFACWATSLFVVRRTIEEIPELREQRGLFLVFLLAIPALHYSTVRTSMAHAPELLLATLTVYFIVRQRLWAAMVAALFLTATRINDAPVIFVVLGAFVAVRGMGRKLVPIALVCLLAALPILYIAFIGRYSDLEAMTVIKRISLPFTAHILWGDQYGLLFTATFWLFVLVAGLGKFSRLDWCTRASVVFLLFLFVVCVGWGGRGASFGYRYLIGSYPFALLVWARLVGVDRRFLKIGWVLMVVNAVWVAHLGWVYDHYSSWYELAVSGRGWVVMKQAFHPVMRFLEYSPVAITVKYLLGRGDFEFNGNFHAGLLPFQVVVTVVLTLIAMIGLGVGLRKTVGKGEKRKGSNPFSAEKGFDPSPS